MTTRRCSGLGLRLELVTQQDGSRPADRSHVRALDHVDLGPARQDLSRVTRPVEWGEQGAPASVSAPHERFACPNYGLVTGWKRGKAVHHQSQLEHVQIPSDT